MLSGGTFSKSSFKLFTLKCLFLDSMKSTQYPASKQASQHTAMFIIQQENFFQMSLLVRCMLRYAKHMLVTI